MMTDDVPCHLTSAFGAGFTAVIFGSPLDVLTTRHMNMPGVFKGPMDCMLSIYK
jgi:solute carrier family 25 uncoupling protein 8/9